MNSYTKSCVPALQKCTSQTSTSQNSACEQADDTCYNGIEGPISEGNFDVYDVREPSNDPYPPETYATYLQSSSVQKAIGAQTTYQECPNGPYQKFAATGDDSRSFLSTLGNLVSSGLRVVLWAGDADWICNYQGGFNVANSITWGGQSQFVGTPLKSYTVNGNASGLYKQVNNLGWVQVYQAGHEVPYYQPQAALQIFKQTLGGQPLTPT